MRALNRFLFKQDNLLPLSSGLTLGILLFIFIVSQLLSFVGLENKIDTAKKMVVREIIKLQFKPEVVPEARKMSTVAQNKVKNSSVRKDETVQKQTQKPDESSSLLSNIKNFDVKKLIRRESHIAKRSTAQEMDLTTTGLSADVDVEERTVADYEFKGIVNKNNAIKPVARKSLAGGNEGTTVALGGNSNSFGNGLDSSWYTIPGRGTSRAGRGNDVGKGGGAKISLPISGGGQDVAIDLHALINPDYV